jgi:hypothetical protein
MPTGVKKTVSNTQKKLSRKSGLKKPKKIKNLVGYYWDGKDKNAKKSKEKNS